MSNVCIVVLNWNGKEDTVKCLHSLKQIHHPVVIVDNGSTDGSQQAFREKFPEYILIETGHNLGYAGGNNVGLSYALKQGYEYIMILNNDTTIDGNVVDAFLEGFGTYPKAGILGAKIYLMDEPKRLDHFGGIWNPSTMEFTFFGYRTLDEGQFEESKELDYVCGACIMIKREALEKVGLFDPRFFLFWEEVDFCFRLKKVGYEVRSCPKAKIWHKVSASFVGGKPHAAYFIYRNRLLWIERNFTGIKRIASLTGMISSQLLNFHSQKAVRTLQVFLQNWMGKDTKRNRERIVRYDAALSGIWDYLFRRFGAGRSKNFMNCV